MADGRIVFRLEADNARMKAQLAEAQRALATYRTRANSMGREIQASMMGMFGGAALVAGGAMLIKTQYDLAKRIEGVNLALRSVTGTTEDYNRAKLMLSVTAQKTGRGILDLTESYKNFTAAVKGSSIEGAVADEMFKDIAKAAGVMGLSVDQTQGTFKAFEQMLSKGCLGIDTPILMFDGSVKMVQDVLVGDELMGDDGTVRTVTKTVTGFETMYLIEQANGTSFRCNANHILAVKQGDTIVKVLAKDFSGQGLGFNNKGETFGILAIRQKADDYYGFEITGSRLFCLSDGTVTHNTVQSEEIRGQLSERLPGAFRILAKSMEVSTEELGKMLKAGEVMADEVLPKFAKQLLITYGADKVEMVDNLASAQSRLSNSWIQLVESMGQKGGLIKSAFDGLSDVLVMIRGYNQDLLTFGEFWANLPGTNATLVLEREMLALAEAEKRVLTETTLLKDAFSIFKKAGIDADGFVTKIDEIRKKEEELNKARKDAGELPTKSMLPPSNIIAAILKMYDDEEAAAIKTKEAIAAANKERLEQQGAVGTLKNLNFQLKEANELLQNTPRGEGFTAIQAKIESLNQSIANFNKEYRLIAPETPERKGMLEGFGDGSGGVVGLQKSAIDQAVADTEDGLRRLTEADQAFQAALVNIGTNLVAGFAEALATGGLKGYFDNLMGILGQGMSDLGRSLIAIGIAEKVAATSFNPAAKIAAGAALVFLGAKFSAASSNLSNRVSGGGSGGGTRGGSFQGNEFGGQTVALNGNFVIRGKDLVYILDQNMKRDSRAKSNF